MIPVGEFPSALGHEQRMRALSLARLEQLNASDPELASSYKQAIILGDGEVERWERNHPSVFSGQRI